MLPQLFVNYKVGSLWAALVWLSSNLIILKKQQQSESKSCPSTDWTLIQQLKSVAHLPWKAFMYKVWQRGSLDSHIIWYKRAAPQLRHLTLIIYCDHYYRQAFNTFIDDVFAFIITMPTSHRLACFRDDVVFLIYLYQRWYAHVQAEIVPELNLSKCSLRPNPSLFSPPGSTQWTKPGWTSTAFATTTSPKAKRTRTKGDRRAFLRPWRSVTHPLKLARYQLFSHPEAPGEIFFYIRLIQLLSHLRASVDSWRLMKSRHVTCCVCDLLNCYSLKPADHRDRVTDV